MRMTIDKAWEGDTLSLTFNNRDPEGNIVGQAADPVTFNRLAVADVQHLNAERHGWEQRFGDAAAMSSDKKTGKAATPAEKRARVQALVEYYQGGAVDWNLKGTGPRVLTPEQKRALLDKLAAELGVTVS